MAREENQRSLRIQIFNKTRNTTLVNHKFDREYHTSPPLKLELPPRSSRSCKINDDSDNSPIRRLVVYWAESFTLAFFVSIFGGVPNFVQLEVSKEKAHLRDLDQTYSRMSKMLYPPKEDRTDAGHGGVSDRGRAFVNLSTGPYKVTATMSHYGRPVLKVMLEDQQLIDRAGNDLHGVL